MYSMIKQYKLMCVILHYMSYSWRLYPKWQLMFALSISFSFRVHYITLVNVVILTAVDNICHEMDKKEKILKDKFIPKHG